MEVALSYGKTNLKVDLPEHVTTVIQPQDIPSLPEQNDALKAALRNPVGTPSLRDICQDIPTIGISVCDITRPVPTSRILPIVLNELKHVPPSKITIFIATGTHRSTNSDDLETILGKQILDSDYRIVCHDAFDAHNLEKIGNLTNGIPVLLNKQWLECQTKIAISLVQPHFFAGFSGGPKMVAPGLAGFKTIMELHSSDMINHRKAVWGITEGNPIHESIKEIAQMASIDFSIDVTTNKDQGITSVYAGNPLKTHRAACQFITSTSMRKVEHKFDIVVTSSGGYPADLNLYQSVKGMSAAAQVVKNRGSILCASECGEGIPDHGNYGQLLGSKSSPKELLAVINGAGHERLDQWQVQIQAKIQTLADVYLKSGGLSDEQILKAHITPIDNISDTVFQLLEKIGPEATICVLPEGPKIVPFVRD